MRKSAFPDLPNDGVKIVAWLFLVLGLVVFAVLLLSSVSPNGGGDGALQWGTVGIAVGSLLSGLFAWTLLRVLVQIRDRIGELQEEENS